MCDLDNRGEDSAHPAFHIMYVPYYTVCVPAVALSRYGLMELCLFILLNIEHYMQ